MAGSSIGNLFRISTWGESHGPALGVVVDGCPAGLPLSEEMVQAYLDRRKPGQSSISTPRKEADQVEILSGVFEGKTTGCPISMVVRNTSQKSHDYSQIKDVYRPGHADFTFDSKYGFRDYRGGGRSSGRETVGRVAAGAVAIELLKQMGIEICGYTQSIGPVQINRERLDFSLLGKNPTNMPDPVANEQAMEYIGQCQLEKDSVGGVVCCQVKNVPAGLGDPVFEKLDANLAKALVSIGAVKAFEIGDGIQVSTAKGSGNNDPFIKTGSGVGKATNHSGGTLGGISDGDCLEVRVHIKPTPSIFQSQKTVNRDGEEVEIQIQGRHDPIIVPRAVVVVESMVAITIVDALLMNMSAKLEKVQAFYNR